MHGRRVSLRCLELGMLISGFAQHDCTARALHAGSMGENVIVEL